MGVHLSALDTVKMAVAAPFVIGRLKAVQLLDGVAPLRPIVDTYVTWLLRQRLRSYGHAEFCTVMVWATSSTAIAVPCWTPRRSISRSCQWYARCRSTVLRCPCTPAVTAVPTDPHARSIDFLGRSPPWLVRDSERFSRFGGRR
jgi:hypothetical protein